MTLDVKVSIRRSAAVFAVALIIQALGFAPDVHAQRDQTTERYDEAADKELAAPHALEQSGIESGLSRKICRLRIAGWTIIGKAVIGFGSIIAIQRVVAKGASEETAGRALFANVILGVSSSVLLATGGGVLIRARLLENRARDEGAQASIGFSGTGAHLRVTW